MNLFDVYIIPLLPVALDCIITDDNGIEYLDLYSGRSISMVTPTWLCS
jgi:acetylornithine aminotransferase